jgi:hypothetical protein
VHHGFVCHEILVILCNNLIVRSVSVNVGQLVGTFDMHHIIRLQKAPVHSVKVKENNELNA